MPAYVLDSNFFIQAHRALYPLDIAVGFWSKIKELAETGHIISIDKVRDELYGHNDMLENWCKESLPYDFFRSSTEAYANYSEVVSWAVSNKDHYFQRAIDDFLDAGRADAFLVAYALYDSDNRILVTQEVSNPIQKKSIKIPEPCNYFGVRYMNMIEMFRELGVTF